jgi:hypothetical protein
MTSPGSILWPVLFGWTALKGRDAAMTSKKDRDEYQQGRRDRDKGVFDQAIMDISENHPDSEAYYKGRRGEQFDEDKDEDE